jgi:hypothetical protein
MIILILKASEANVQISDKINVKIHAKSMAVVMKGMTEYMSSGMSNTMSNREFCCQLACLGHPFRHGLGMLRDMTLGMFFGFTGY